VVLKTDRVIEVVGVSPESWEAAGHQAVAQIASTAGLRAAEIDRQDLVVENGAVVGYRVRLAVAYDPAAVLLPPSGL
jgi:flavin-binding protein dodecin